MVINIVVFNDYELRWVFFNFKLLQEWSSPNFPLQHQYNVKKTHYKVKKKNIDQGESLWTRKLPGF